MASTQSAVQPEAEIRVPSAQTLLQAATLAIKMDRAVMLDYYMDTFSGRAVIGEDEETKDKLLVKSNDQYTSLIQKIYKSGNGEDFIVLTENSIYIISAKVQKKRIKAANFIGNDE